MGATAMGTQHLIRYIERIRLELEHMRQNIEEVMEDYATPSVGHQRNLYMSQMIDAIAAVRHCISRLRK